MSSKNVIVAPDGQERQKSRRRSLASVGRRYWRALRDEKLARLLLLSVALLLAGALAVYGVERDDNGSTITSFGEALWYGIVTMTTVGYGDLTPKTAAGRLVGVILMLGGMTVLSLCTATIASALVAERIRNRWGLEASQKMTDHVLVCGWNDRALGVLEGLVAPGNRQSPVVLVNEMPEQAMDETLFRFRDYEVHHIHGDPAAESVLTKANVRRARAAVIVADASRGAALASDERTILVTLAIKSLKPEVKVTAEALDLKSEAHLRRAGADDIVTCGEFNSFLLSSAAMAPGISHVVRHLLSRNGNELRQYPIPAEFVGRTFGELFLALHSRHGFLTIAVVSESQGLALDDLLTDDYSLVDQFIKQQLSRAGKEYLRFEERGLRVLVNPPESYAIGKGDVAIGIARST